jgi:hypothetical protein
MSRRTGGAVAFVLDPDTWVREATDVPRPGDRHEERLRVLREAGWTALSVPRGAPLNALWQQADRVRSGLAAVSGETGT